jgi:hypothetical protein
VVRTALNTGASWWHRRGRELPLADHDVAVPGSQGTGLDTAMLAALRRLSARQREVIALRVFLDLDIETTGSADRRGQAGPAGHDRAGMTGRDLQARSLDRRSVRTCDARSIARRPDLRPARDHEPGTGRAA